MITNALGVSFSDLMGASIDKKTSEIENEIAVVAGLIRGLDKKNRTLVFSAVKGIIGAIEKV